MKADVTTPFFNNYRPQFYFRTTDVTGCHCTSDGVEMCMPGDNVEMNVELITPIAIEVGLRLLFVRVVELLVPALLLRFTNNQ